MVRLSEKFDIKFIGDAKYLLGWEIQRDRRSGTLHLKQEKYIKKIVQRFAMNECKTECTNATRKPKSTDKFHRTPS